MHMPELTSGTLVGITIALAIALPLAALVLARTLRDRSAWAVSVGQWVLVALAQGAAVFMVLLIVNNQYGLYASWNDLFGIQQSGTQTATIDPLAPGHFTERLGQGFTKHDVNGTFGATVRIPGTGQAMDLYVSLPSQYFDPKYAKSEFPVVELLHGYPGSPWTWLNALDVRTQLQSSVAAGGTPFVLVLPQMSVPGAPDLECMDVRGQPQLGSFLSSEVHDIITSRFRVRSDRSGWGLMGYSEGGYCAGLLAMQHPGLYSAAVSIAGYSQPESSFFANKPKDKAAGSYRALLAKRPAVAILATASKQDPQSAGSLTVLQKYAKPPTMVTTRDSATGGHNAGVWAAELPADFAWLSSHLARVM